ncbi:hypothetical protein [Flyfo microvirus Tbat2_151]|nr:hypothetical protein [Flyfo microvirus Tbat2_151]
MARRSRSRRSSPARRAISISSANRPPRLSGLSSLVAPLTLYEDRRTFVPNRFTRPAMALPRAAAQLVASNKNVNVNRTPSVPSQVRFANPRRVVLCVRRNIRKEVLLASGGAFKRNKRKPRRNQFSDVSC